MDDSLGEVDPPQKRRTLRDVGANQGQRIGAGVTMDIQGSFCYYLEKVSLTRLFLCAAIVVSVMWAIVSVVHSWTLLSNIGPSNVESTTAFTASSIGRAAAGNGRTGDSLPAEDSPPVVTRTSKTTYRKTVVTTTGPSGSVREQDEEDAGGDGMRDREDPEKHDQSIPRKPSPTDRVPDCVWIDELAGYFCWVPMGREVNKENPFPPAGILRGSTNGASVFHRELQCSDTTGKIYTFPPSTDISAELAFDSKMNGYYLEISTKLDSLTSSWCKLFYIIVK